MTLSALLKKTLVLGAVWAATIAVVGGVIGVLTAGLPGLLGVAIGAVVAAAFLGLTAASIMLAVRVTKGDMLNPAYFAIVLGGWTAKFILFLVVLLVLRPATWLNPTAFFFAVVAAILGSLAIDTYVFLKSRMPYVDVKLPHSSDDPETKPAA